MFGLFSARRSTPKKLLDTHVGPLVDSVNVGGFDLGVFSDASRHQATINFAVDTEISASESAWSAWEDSISGLDRLVATVTIDTVGPAGPADHRATAIFQATSKATRKDNDDLVAELMSSETTSRLFQAAGELGLPPVPMSSDMITRALAAGLGSRDSEDIHDIVADETDASVVLPDDEVTVFVSAALAPGINDHVYELMTAQIDEILAGWTNNHPDIPLRRSRIFRPFVDLSGHSEAPSVSATGRRWQLISVGGGEAGVAALRAEFPAVLDLRISRGWLRQRVLLLEALGTGVLGFQRTDDIKHPDYPTAPAA